MDYNSLIVLVWVADPGEGEIDKESGPKPIWKTESVTLVLRYLVQPY